MKKVHTIVLFLILPIISLSQFQVGINSGYIYYFFTDPNDNPHYIYDYNYTHNAFSLAVSIKQRSESTFNHSIGIQYTNRSFAVKSILGGLASHGRKEYHYNIGNIFIQLKPEFVFGSNVKFFFYPGIGFGTLIHSSLYGTTYGYNIMGQSYSDTINGSAKEYYPNFEMTVLVGFGIEVPFNNILRLAIDNNLSMNVLPIAGAWGEENIKMFDINLAVGLVYTFYRKNSKSVNIKD